MTIAARTVVEEQEPSERQRERRVEERVDAVDEVEAQVQHHEGERRGDLGPAAPWRRLRVGDHEEHEQEERRRGQRAEEQGLGRQVPAHDVRPQRDLQEVEAEEGDDEGAPSDAEDEQGQGGGHHERRHGDGAAPLVGGGGADQVAGEQERQRDAEHRGVEDVRALVGQEVLGGDGEVDREEEEP
jgi:hypothetical protein